MTRYALLALALLGCSSPKETPPHPRTIELAVDSHWRIIDVAIAAKEWELCGVIINVHLGQPTSVDDYTVLLSPDLPLAGQFVEEDRQILYSGSADRKTFAHEIGHLLGLGHASSGVMRQGPSYAHVTQKECDALK